MTGADHDPAVGEGSRGGEAPGTSLLLRVTRGRPTPAELAALTTVVAGMRATAVATDEPSPPSRWIDRAALVRRPLRPGPGAWRASAHP